MIFVGTFFSIGCEIKRSHKNDCYCILPVETDPVRFAFMAIVSACLSDARGIPWYGTDWIHVLKNKYAPTLSKHVQSSSLVLRPRVTHYRNEKRDRLIFVCRVRLDIDLRSMNGRRSHLRHSNMNVRFLLILLEIGHAFVISTRVVVNTDISTRRWGRGWSLWGSPLYG